jgi:hypothetical protein
LHGTFHEFHKFVPIMFVMEHMLKSFIYATHECHTKQYLSIWETRYNMLINISKKYLHVITKEWIFFNLFLAWNFAQMSKIEIKGILFHIFLEYKEIVAKFWKINFIFQKHSPHFYLRFRGGPFLVTSFELFEQLVKA